MDTGNYGADRLGGSFGKNDRMDSETNRGKNHDGGNVSLSRGHDGKDRVTVSRNGSSKSYSLNDYVSKNNSEWGSQGLSPISRAAATTRTSVTGVTGTAKTLTGQLDDDPNQGLLSSNPDKYLEKTIGKGFVDYIDNPVTNKMSWESYSNFRDQGKQFKAGNIDKTFGLNTVGNIIADTVSGIAGSIGKGIGSAVAANVGGMLSNNIGNIAEGVAEYAKTNNLTDAQKAAFNDGVNEVKQAIEDNRSFGTKIFNGAATALTLNPATAPFGAALGFAGSLLNHEDKKRAVAAATGKLAEYEADLKARHQALLDDAKRRSLDGSNQGILSQMTARINPQSTQQQDKWQDLYDKLPNLNHLWNNIYIS